MTKALINSFYKHTGLSALVGLAFFLNAHVASGQNLSSAQTTESKVGLTQGQRIPFANRTNFNYDEYILGPGDGLSVELIDLPELSGVFSIGPDGTLYLPRLRSIYVEGLTIEELRNFLTQQFSTYVRDPQVYIRPVSYRPIRVYVGGEVKRPGYYTLGSGTNTSPLELSRSQQVQAYKTRAGLNNLQDGTEGVVGVTRMNTFGTVFPRVFDAIRTAQGITPYTDLTKVQVVRKRAESRGGGHIKTNLNFLSLITNGDDSQNIRLADGDSLNIGKSPVVLREQLIKAGQSNISPQFMEVFVTGRVNMPGGIVIPQGSTLNQAISLAGGTKILKGRVEFVRFKRDGTIDRRLFAYSPRAAIDAINNPILAAGDLVRVQESLISGGVSALTELTAPFVNLYTTYSLFNSLFQ